jgi:hypothetical protein
MHSVDLSVETDEGYDVLTVKMLLDLVSKQGFISQIHGILA